MIRSVLFFFLLNLLFCEAKGQSQNRGNNPWIVGVYLNTVNNSGEAFQEPLNFKENYLFSLPFKLSAEKRVYNDYGLQAAFTTNRATEGQNVANMVDIDTPVTYLALDLTLKYYITNLFLHPDTPWEGYILVGPGVGFFDDVNTNYLNIGVGTNIKLTERFRLALQGTAKRSISNRPIGASHVQYDLGCIYITPW